MASSPAEYAKLKPLHGLLVSILTTSSYQKDVACSSLMGHSSYVVSKSKCIDGVEITLVVLTIGH